MHDGQVTTQTPWRGLGILPPLTSFAAALVIRFAHLWALTETPFFLAPVTDAPGYEYDAHLLLDPEFSGAPFYRPPLFVFIRAALLALDCGSPWIGAIVHAFAGSLTAALLCIAAFHLAAGASIQRSAAWIAGLSTAAYGPFIAYDLESLPPVWINLAVATTLCVAVWERPRLDAWDLVGACAGGIAIIGWPPVSLFSFALLFIRRKKLASRGAASLVLLLFVTALPCACTAAYNARQGAPGVLVSANVGINLRLGNNPRWRATWQARPGLGYDEVYEEPTRAGVVGDRPREVFYFAESLAYVRDAPFDALLRTAEKFFWFFHGREIRRDHDLMWLREQSPILRPLLWEAGLMFPFGLLLPIALICPRGALTVRRTKVAMIVVGYALLIALCFPCARYRLPALVLLLPVAAVSAASWVIGRASLIAPRREASAILVALALLCNIPASFTAGFAASPSERARLLSKALLVLGKIDDAELQARRSASLSPSDPDALLQLASVLVARDNLGEAVAVHEQTVRLAPTSEAAWVRLAQTQIRARQYVDAEKSLQRALQRNPYHNQALRDLAGVRMVQRDVAGAIVAFEAYRRAGHSDEGALFDLIRLLRRNGEPRRAQEVLREALREYPHSVKLGQLAQP